MLPLRRNLDDATGPGNQNYKEKLMKLDQIDQVNEKELNRRIRYRVTLTTKAGANTVFWQTHLNGNSPQEAVMTAHQLFRKDRGEIQSAVMSKWEIREVTPTKKVEGV